MRKSREYDQVKRMGCKFYTPHFVLLVHDNSLNHSRLGITVSRKVGNSVQRNRIKRLVRDFFRLLPAAKYEKRDYSIIARRGISLLSASDINAELLYIFKKTFNKNV